MPEIHRPIHIALSRFEYTTLLAALYHLEIELRRPQPTVSEADIKALYAHLLSHRDEEK